MNAVGLQAENLYIFMRKFRCLFIALSTLILTVLTFQSHAQQAVLYGKVTDKDTGEELAGANVYIKGTTQGVSTNLDGNFELRNLAPGTYTIVCSYISYKTIEFADVRVQSGQTLQKDIVLESDAFLIEGVTVVARRSTSTDMALISSIKSAEIVVSGISAQQIKRSQDSDAAEVVKRVPGVTIVGNRFINIRGLVERYNSVLLHDVYAPSMEADVRSFSFDIIPSSLIDRIMIYKSPSPELPGDFAGGVVKIYTKGIPDEDGLQVSYSAGFIEGVALGTFQRAAQDKGFWRGFNTGKYNLPNGFVEDVRKISDDAEQVMYTGRSLPNSWVAEEIPVLWNNSGSVTYSKRFNLPRNQYLGSITSISYNNKKTRYSVARKDFNSWDETAGSSVIYNFDDLRNLQNIRMGIMQNLAWSINPKHIIELKNIYNQLSQTEYIHRTGPHYDFGYLANNHSFYEIFRGIYAGQLTGNHQMNDKNSLDWVLGYGFSYRDEPDYRRFRSDYDSVTGQSTLYVPFGAAASYFLGRFYSEMTENNYTFSLNYSHKPGVIGGLKPVINSGFFVESKDRVFKSRNLGYIRASLLGFNPGLLDVSIDSLFHPDNINPTFGLALDEQSNPSDSYSAANLNIAGYVSLFVPLTQRLNFTGGFRLENNRQTLNSFTLTNDPVDVDLSGFDVLPSVNISYSFGENMLVRAAYGKTLNRPEFRELAPFGFYDFNFNLVKKGSDSIRNATIHNFDLRWEYYPSGNEIINFGFFYKRFNNPIETSFVPGGGSGGIKTFTFANAASATSIGIEAEFRKSLKGMLNSGFADRLNLLFNAALIQSSVELGNAGLGQAIKSRSMYGQSPYIINAGIYFHDPISSLYVNMLYNVIGKRIYIVGYDDYPDIYEMPRNLLDLTITKNFGKHFEIKMGVSNILNKGVLLLQDGNQDWVFDRENDQQIQRYLDPRSYSIGFSYNF
jgi:outer membrane receptor for ferrienterochelin and colicin